MLGCASSGVAVLGWLWWARLAGCSWLAHPGGMGVLAGPGGCWWWGSVGKAAGVRRGRVVSIAKFGVESGGAY